MAIFILIAFNLLLGLFMANTGKELVNNTKKSGILEISKDAQREMGTQR